MRVLLVEDDNILADGVANALRGLGYAVDSVASGIEADRALTSEQYDLVLLDIELPTLDGLEVLRRLRKRKSDVPVIMLTARDSLHDRIHGLDMGADDYLTKPFSVPELLARIRVALRHSQSKEESPVFRSGPFEMDYAGHVVKVSGQIIKLTSTEFDILKVLTRYAGKVVTHRLLLKEVWGPNAVEHTQYLRVYLGQIRKKIQIDPAIPDLIQTEPGVGYRFSVLDPL